MNRHEEYFLEFERAKIDLYIEQLRLREKETKRKAFIRIFIGTFLGIIVLGCMLFLFMTEIPAGNRDVVIALVSGLTGAFFGSVVTYYFGDSDSRNDPPATPSFSAPKPAIEDDDVIKKDDENEKNGFTTFDPSSLDEPTPDPGVEKE